VVSGTDDAAAVADVQAGGSIRHYQERERIAIWKASFHEDSPHFLREDLAVQADLFRIQRKRLISQKHHPGLEFSALGAHGTTKADRSQQANEEALHVCPSA
jgi:hypothetical protein